MKKILLPLVFASSALMAEGTFGVGNQHFGFSLSQSGDYTVIGGHVNYYVVDNLSVGLGATTWVGDEPSINRLTIPVTYYVPLDFYIRPYIGAFGSYTFVGDDGDIKYDNFSSFGARVGGVMNTSSNSYVYAGWVQVKHNGDTVVDNNEGYPEFGIGFAF